jgi:TonB-dependent starch-binding outer membrane protein SusC
LLQTDSLKAKAATEENRTGVMTTTSVTKKTIRSWGGMIISPQELMLGHTPGMIISSNSGVPGGSYTIHNMRFNSSFSSGAPLIIVDGLVLGNDLESINPNDIETITFLENSSETAIYGEQAAFGALVITTRKGTGDFKVNYSGQAGFSVLPRKTDILSADEFRELVNTRYPGNTSVTGLLADYNTDWQDEIYRKAFGQDHHLSVSGEIAKKIPMYLSVGETDMDGILKTSSYNRTTGSLSLEPSFFDDHLNISLNLKGIFHNNRAADEQAISNSPMFDPTQPVSDGNTTYGGYFTYTNFDGTPVITAPTNPVALLNLTNDRQDEKRIIGNIKADYRLHFLPDLRVIMMYGLDNLKTDQDVTMGTDASWTYIYNGGYSGWSKYSNKTSELSVCTDYSRECKAVSGNLDFMLGYFSENENYTYSSYATNLNTPLFVIDHFDSEGRIAKPHFSVNLNIQWLKSTNLI